MTAPRGLLWLATGAFAAGMSALAVLQHRAFETGRFDVGNLTQAVWSTANGRFLEVTGLQGDQFSRLGAHFDPLVVLLAPLWWIWPDPAMLLVVQAVAVSLGALPVFLLARKHLGTEWGGLAFALVYLLYPATQWLVVDDFHPVAFATPLLAAAIWFLDQDRLLPFALCAAAACASKEQVGLVVAMLGLWYALGRGKWRPGTLIAVGGGAVSVAGALLVVPHFSPGGGSPFGSRYSSVGGSPGGILETALTDPLRLFDAMTGPRDLSYLVDLLGPLAGLSLAAPLLAAAALPELLLNVLSDTRTQTSIHYHYAAATTPVLIGAAVIGTGRLTRRRPRVVSVVGRLLVVVALVAGVVLGPLPPYRHLPFGSTLGTQDHVVTAHDRAAEWVILAVPPAVAVSATNTLGAHLSERRRIFSFPVLREARWVAVDVTRPSYRDDAIGKRFAPAYAALRQDPRWRVVRERDGVVVLRRSDS